MIVPSCHDLQAGWCAQGLGVSVGEAQAGCREFVNVGRLVVPSSITSEALNADVIRHDENDMFGKICGSGGHSQCRRQNNSHTDKPSNHEQRLPYPNRNTNLFRPQGVSCLRFASGAGRSFDEIDAQTD